MGIAPIWISRAITSLIYILIFTQKCQCYRLDEAELEQIFGNWRPLDYEVFQPKLNDHRTRRSVDDDSSIFEFQALNQNFKFKLHPVEDLFSADFVILERDGNGTHILDNEKVSMSCAFQGEDQNDPRKTIAVVTCGNLRGVVKSPFDEFVIEPLPESVRRRHSPSHHRMKRRSSDLLNDHIIYKRKAIQGCSVHEEPSSDLPEQLDREYLHSRYSSLDNQYSASDKFGAFESAKEDTYDTKRTFGSATVYIETAVFVDKDLLTHMKTNFPTNTEQEVIEVVLAMVNAVQLLYNDPSLGYKVKYVLKRLELLYKDPGSLTRPHDIDDFLTKFCSWQHLENPATDGDPFHWDHALILTGLDLHTTAKEGKFNSQVVGLAPVAGMCTRTSSCTVNEGRHFESVYVVAHEIGHNLGMRHDGIQSGNNCDPSGYLMSPTLGSGKVTWSHCSKRYLNKFLNTAQAKCLQDKPRSPMKHLNHESKLLPGERFTADQQCMLKYGVGSRSSTNQKQHEICRDLHCIRDQYTWTSHPALEGTQCGNYMWCRRGSCSDRPRDQSSFYSDSQMHPMTFNSPKNHYNKPSSNPFKSSSGGLPLRGEWGRWSDCRSSCLYGMDGVLSSGSTGLATAQRQCHSCAGEKRYLSCSAVRECSIRHKRTLQDFADEMCSRLRIDESSLSGYSTRLPHSGIRSCQIDCMTKSGSSTSTRTFFPDGTVCRTSATNFPTYCIEGYCTEFRCESTTLYGAGPNTCRSSSMPRPSLDILNPLRPFAMPVEAVASPPSVISEHVWSPWVTSSSCRFSCLSPSRGIQLVSRSCLDPPRCQGLNKNIKLCNPTQTECSVVHSPFSFASDVCDRYSKSVKELSGIGMQLTSIAEDPDRGCTVACQDAALKYRFYKVNGKDGWFPFGTECSSPQDKYKAFCLNGKCVEFSGDGTPLRNTGMGSMVDKGRSLSFFAFDPLGSNLPSTQDVSVQTTHWRFKRNSQKRQKREVKITSHRLPGSFEDSFLLSLIDEINATFVSNETENKNDLGSSIDLANPVFHRDEAKLPSSGAHFKGIEKVPEQLESPIVVLRNFKPAPIYKKATHIHSLSVSWRKKNGRCSVTCGEGFQREVWSCVDEDGGFLESFHCLHQSRPRDSIRPCVATKKCSSTEHNSGFGKWLFGIVEDIKRKH